MKKISKTLMGFVFGILVALTIDVAAETLIDSGAVSYSNSKTSETTVDGALDELFSAIDISKQIGSTDISNIGDGTITGAISTVNTMIDDINNFLNLTDTTGKGILSLSAGTITANSFRKSGNIVNMSFNIQEINDTITSSSIIGVVPEGFRPPFQVWLTGSLYLDTGSLVPIMISIDSSGNIRQHIYTSVNVKSIFMNGTYPLAV